MNDTGRLAQLFQALADPTRLHLLNLLRREECCATDLNTALGMSQPRVARHLKILVDAGLLVSRREGRFVRYSLAREGGEGALVAAALDRLSPLASVTPVRSAAGEVGPRPARVPFTEAGPPREESAPDDEDRGDRPGPIEDFLL